MVDVNILTGPTSPGGVLAVLRRNGPMTRQELQDLVGLSRATIVERLDTLRRLRMLRAVGHRASSGGRRAELLAADESSRVAVVADIGVSHATVAVADLQGTVLALHGERLPVGHRPEQVLPALVETAERLLGGLGRRADVAATGLSFPGQLDQTTGVSTVPPDLSAWRHHPLRTVFDADPASSDAPGADPSGGHPSGVHLAGVHLAGTAPFVDGAGQVLPRVLENDANALAYGEYLAAGRRGATVLGVKVGTGIGAGVVIGDLPHRGATGCAGEIGHIRIEGRDERCGCGRRGCVAALASGKALVRALRHSGVRTLSDVVRRIAAGDPVATRLTHDAGRLLGTVLATVVTILNPHVVRIGGEIGHLAPFLAGLTETLAAAAHVVAARGLDVGPARLGDRAPLVGLAGLAAEAVFAPAAVDRLAAG